MAWHCDSLDSYALKFSVDDPSKVKRYWFSVDNWHDGHVFQVSKTVLSNWTRGAAYDIPFGTGHASSNFGYRPDVLCFFYRCTRFIYHFILAYRLFLFYIHNIEKREGNAFDCSFKFQS